MTDIFKDIPLLDEVYNRFGNEDLCLFIYNYMKNDGGIVARAVDVLSRVRKRWGEEPYMFLVGYIGDGDFPKIEKPDSPRKLPERDKYGRWTTPF